MQQLGVGGSKFRTEETGRNSSIAALAESGFLHFSPSPKIKGPEEACQNLDVNVSLCAQEATADGTKLECSLAIQLELTGAEEESFSCQKAILEPFAEAFAAHFPGQAATRSIEHSQLRVRYWAGPRKSAADFFTPEYRTKDMAKKLQLACTPAWCLVEGHEPRESAGAMVSWSAPTAVALRRGETLISMLHDRDAEMADMHALVDLALHEGGEVFEGVACARDACGRTALHLCVTRGDLTLCRKLMRTDAHVLAVDDNKDSALHLASIAGRALIVRALLARGALALEKNRDLMSPLQLACVDEAQGNGEVIRLLVESGAPVDAKCWDTTPLQAAAASGHHWAVQVLLELGADVNLINGSCMGALDYARDQHTAQLLLDYIEGRLLPDAAHETAARHRAQRGRFGANGQRVPGAEDAEPRAFQSVRSMSLEAAMAHLGLPEEWAEPFRRNGEHFPEIRRAWRRRVQPQLLPLSPQLTCTPVPSDSNTVALASHPDKLSSSAEEDVKRKASCDFASAMAAFEVIDAYNAKFTGT